MNGMIHDLIISSGIDLEKMMEELADLEKNEIGGDGE
jgi:hypothetical protein